MTRKRKYIIILLILACTVSFVGFKASDRYFEIAKNLEIFAAVYKEINTYYVDDVNPNTLMRTGIDAMLSSLDPYTNYIPEDDIEDFRFETTGQYGGIGIESTRMNGKILVTRVFEGYPAFKAGITVGDEVVKIDGVDIQKLSPYEVSNLMKGQLSSNVVVTIRKYGDASTEDLTMKREKISVPNVPYYALVSEDVGYFILSGFTMDAANEAHEAVTSLIAKGAKKIIMDLRGNPGGIVDEAVGITNIFLPKGLEVVYTRGKMQDPSVNRSFKTRSAPVDTEIPLAVLVNSGSASASEIVAGTIQDLDRGVIIGERSFGKGLVQQPRPLSYNSQVKITIAKYYIPSGRSIQALDYTHRRPDGSVGKVPDSLKTEYKTKNGRPVYDGGGISPDIEVETPDYSTIGAALLDKGLIFEYASEYKSKHGKIPPPKFFKLSDEEYNQFLAWLGTQDFTYTTPAEEDIQDLIASAENEKYYSYIQGQIEDLQNTILKGKKADLTLNKEEIKELLEEDIVSMYYPESGIIESSFKYDGVLNKAIEVLENTSRYKSILAQSK